MNENLCVYCTNQKNGDLCPVCCKDSSAYQAAPHHLKPGTMLSGRYLVASVLGEGGFGITYIGRDTRLNMAVAIKEYYPSGMVNRTGSTAAVTANMGDAEQLFEKGKKNFLAEAQTLAKFASDPNVVSVRDFFEENDTAYIVMEYLQGRDLKEFLDDYGPMSFTQVFRMLSPVMSVLGKIHDQQLIHRDISPSNIMILDDRTVKLLDFGAARQVSPEAEKSLSVMLKPGYAPEEQYRSKGKQGPWTDIYALSATMYKLMTGITPDDSMNRMFRDELTPISEINPRVTPSQEAVIAKGMAVFQEDRYQTMAELQSACTAVEKDVPIKDPEITVRGGAGTKSTNDPDITVRGGTGTKSDNVPEVTVRKRTPRTDSGNGNTVGPNSTGHTPGSSAAGGGTRTRTTRKPERTPEKPDPVHEEKPGKKPSVPCLIGAVALAVPALILLWLALQAMLDPSIDGFPWLQTVGFLVLGAASVVLSRFYFPRFDNKRRKPNTLALIGSIAFLLLTVLLAWLGVNSISENGSTDSGSIAIITSVMLPAAGFLFCGYFYYPRLNPKKKRLFTWIYGGAAAAAVVFLLVSTVLTSLTTVTIGDKRFERDTETVEITVDILTNQDVEKLKSLKQLKVLRIRGSFMDNEDVQAIGELTQLRVLSLYGNTDITDISSLRNLTQLEELNLEYTSITDLSVLKNMPNLTALNISRTDVSDLSVLQNLTKLTTLHMSVLRELNHETIILPASITYLACDNNKLTNLDFLEPVADLHTFSASNNLLTDVEILAKFPNLGSAYLNYNELTDITPLTANESGSLTYLYLTGNNISDISPLTDFTVKYLELGYNEIRDLTPLANHSDLLRLNVSNNYITDISPLAECFRIIDLDISFNQISDIGIVAGITDLEFFAMRGNRIADISCLANHATLIESGSTLDLRDNLITDISALAGYVNTKSLYLSNNQITDISPLASCTALKYVYMNNNQVQSLKPLFGLKNLGTVKAVNNPINSLDGLHVGSESGSLAVNYTDDIDWAAVSSSAVADDTKVSVYYTPERQIDALRKAENIIPYSQTYSVVWDEVTNQEADARADAEEEWNNEE